MVISDFGWFCLIFIVLFVCICITRVAEYKYHADKKEDDD